MSKKTEELWKEESPTEMILKGWLEMSKAEAEEFAESMFDSDYNKSAMHTFLYNAQMPISSNSLRCNPADEIKNAIKFEKGKGLLTVCTSEVDGEEWKEELDGMERIEVIAEFLNHSTCSFPKGITKENAEKTKKHLEMFQHGWKCWVIFTFTRLCVDAEESDKTKFYTDCGDGKRMPMKDNLSDFIKEKGMSNEDVE